MSTAVKSKPSRRVRPQWQKEVPDSDTTVLIRLEDAEDPIILGFHDGERWRTADATRCHGIVLGWMDLPAAVALLDGPAA